MSSRFLTIDMFALLMMTHMYASAQSISYQLVGTTEAELNMQHRLVAIAEGLPPSKDFLETEFEFIYYKSPSYSEDLQDFIATGSFPFNPKHASFYSYKPSSKSPRRYSVSFFFLESNQLRTVKEQPFCVSKSVLVAELVKKGWEYRKWIVQPHRMREEGLFLTLNGFAREIHIWPIEIGCIKTISVRYEELPQSPTHDRK